MEEFWFGLFFNIGGGAGSEVGRKARRMKMRDIHSSGGEREKVICLRGG